MKLLIASPWSSHLPRGTKRSRRSWRDVVQVLALRCLLPQLVLVAVLSPAHAVTLGPLIGPCVGTGSPATYPPVGNCTSFAGRDEAYSVVVGGNYTIMQGAESEGKIYVGASMLQNTGGNYNVVHAGPGSCVVPINSNAPGGSPHLLIGANLVLAAGSQLLVGLPSLVSNVLIGGARTGPGTLSTAGTVQTGATLPPSPADFANLDNLADYWATLTPNGTIVSSNGTFNFNGDGSANLQVFRRNTGINVGFGATLRFNAIPATATVLIVIAQSGVVTLNTSEFVDTAGMSGFGFSSALTRRILRVFPNASRVDFVGGSQWRGNALVPSGSAMVGVSGFNGRFIVSGDLEQNGTGAEFHNYDFPARCRLQPAWSSARPSPAMRARSRVFPRSPCRPSAPAAVRGQ